MSGQLNCVQGMGSGFNGLGSSLVDPAADIEVLAHDLRTPLSAIRLLSEALADRHGESARVRHLSDQMRCISGTLCDTLESVLDARRLRSGQSQWAACDLEAKARQAVSTVRPLIGQLPIRIVGPVGHAVPMMGDRGALRRLLVNLLANSIRHVSVGGVVVTLDHVRRKRSWNIVTVSDSGRGIDPYVLAKLRSAPDAVSGGGTGLGLRIAQAVVAAHGGVLEIETAQGVGTTVRAILRADMRGPRPGGAVRTIRFRTNECA